MKIFPLADKGYTLKIDKREHPSWDPETMELMDYWRLVTVTTTDGRKFEFKVGMKILGNERLWQQFQDGVIHSVVRGLPIIK